MLGFLIGLVVGGLVGVIIMALMAIASSEDDAIKKRMSKRDM